MLSATRPSRLYALVLLGVLVSSACGGPLLRREHEYEEELYLSLDGSATLDVNASVAALVALRGFDLDVNPRARLDRDVVRRLFEGPGVTVSQVSLSRRHGRRFVHVGLDVADVRRLTRLAPFAWSTYRFESRGDVVTFDQSAGASANRPVGDVGWTGGEVVAFRIHIPSEITFHNTKGVQRGNILEWEQPLAARLEGARLDLQVQMEPQSILYSTLILFGATILAAALAFAVVIWLIVRRGRADDAAPPRP